MDIHTNIHSVKYLCTTSAAITRLFRVSFYRGKKTLLLEGATWIFVWLDFFLIVFVGEAQTYIDNRRKKSEAELLPRDSLQPNNFYTFPVRYFLHPYWQSLQQKTVICVRICRQEGIYFEVLRKKLFHNKIFKAASNFI